MDDFDENIFAGTLEYFHEGLNFSLIYYKIKRVGIVQHTAI